MEFQGTETKNQGRKQCRGDTLIGPSRHRRWKALREGSGGCSEQGRDEEKPKQRAEQAFLAEGAARVKVPRGG